MHARGGLHPLARRCTTPAGGFLALLLALSAPASAATVQPDAVIWVKDIGFRPAEDCERSGMARKDLKADAVERETLCHDMPFMGGKGETWTSNKYNEKPLTKFSEKSSTKYEHASPLLPSWGQENFARKMSTKSFNTARYWPITCCTNAVSGRKTPAPTAPIPLPATGLLLALALAAMMRKANHPPR